MSEDKVEKVWTDDMGEISGFGGGYESSCRAMVIAGVEWLASRNDDTLLEFSEFKNVTGVIMSESPAAKALMEHMAEACKDHGMSLPPDDGPDAMAGLMCEGHREAAEQQAAKIRDSFAPSGAMMQYTVKHALLAHRMGWDVYCAKRRAVTAEEHATAHWNPSPKAEG